MSTVCRDTKSGQEPDDWKTDVDFQDNCGIVILGTDGKIDARVNAHLLCVSVRAYACGRFFFFNYRRIIIEYMSANACKVLVARTIKWVPTHVCARLPTPLKHTHTILTTMLPFDPMIARRLHPSATAVW